MNVVHGGHYERVLWLTKCSNFKVNILKYKQYNKCIYTESIRTTFVILWNIIALSRKSLLDWNPTYIGSWYALGHHKIILHWILRNLILWVTANSSFAKNSLLQSSMVFPNLNWFYHEHFSFFSSFFLNWTIMSMTKKDEFVNIDLSTLFLWRNSLGKLVKNTSAITQIAKW